MPAALLTVTPTQVFYCEYCEILKDALRLIFADVIHCFRLRKLEQFVSGLVFGELQLTQISLNFQTSSCILKIRGQEAKLYVAFLLF